MIRGHRILIVVSFANLAGAQIAAVRVARGLRDRGYEPKVVFLYQQSPVDSPDHPYEVLLTTAKPGIFGYLQICSKMVQLVRRERPDIMLTFLPLANITGQSIACLAGVRRRVVSHRMPINTASLLLRLLDRIWARFGVYSSIIAVSESVRASCRHYPAWLKKRITVVHNGVREWHPSALTRQQARSRFEIADGKFALVAVGRLVHQKNYHLMLRIMQRLDDAILLIAGEGPLRVELEREINLLGIAGKVTLLGEVSRPEIPDLLAAADIFIQTSTYEGQSNSILEALQARVPIVAHDIPEQRETLREEDGSVPGGLVRVGDLTGWIAEIERLRNDPIAMQTAREVGSRRGRVFCFDTMVTGFEEVLVTQVGDK